MDDYTKQLTGYFLITIIGAVFIVIEAIAIELQLKVYIITFIAISLSAAEIYIILMLKHLFKIPISESIQPPVVIKTYVADSAAIETEVIPTPTVPYIGETE